MSLENPEIQKLLVSAKASYYREFVRVWVPDQPYIHYPKGVELAKKQHIAQMIDSDEDTILYETNQERSLRRTRKAIKDYVHMNDFEWFATFTFAKNRYDDVSAKRRFANWLRNQRKRNGQFRYLVVIEEHKDGALHFHVLMGGYKGRLEYAKNPHTGKKIADGHGDYVRNFSEYKLGHSTAKKITNSMAAVRYIQKYITKENVATFGKNRYWISKNLRRPIIVENPEPFYRLVEADRHYVLDHGTILEFDKGNHPLIDTFIEAYSSEVKS